MIEEDGKRQVAAGSYRVPTSLRLMWLIVHTFFPVMVSAWMVHALLAGGWYPGVLSIWAFGMYLSVRVLRRYLSVRHYCVDTVDWNATGVTLRLPGTHHHRPHDQ